MYLNSKEVENAGGAVGDNLYIYVVNRLLEINKELNGFQEEK